MVLPEKIRIIEKSYQFTLKEKGSEFIAEAIPVNNIDSAGKTLASVRKKLINASHYCYAYKLTDNIVKFSDDGEPAGSAGIRILNAIDHFELWNILVVVTRYFGGTKLGIGPLGKAYYKSAYNLLNKTIVVEKKLYTKLLVQLDFSSLGHLYHLVSNYKGKIEELKYDENASYNVLVKPADVENFSLELIDISGGKVKIDQNQGKIYL